MVSGRRSAPLDRAALRDQLARHRLLAIVRGTDVGASRRTVLALVEAGLRIVELSLAGTAALDVLTDVIGDLPVEAVVGAGTVLSADDAARAIDAGAAFVVTPAWCGGSRSALDAKVGTISGALTPTEVVMTHEAGALVKLFPADLAGGARYVRALRAPLPQVDLVPVGGVDVEGGVAMLAAGALAVGVGSPLVGDAADGGSLTALGERARRYLSAVEELDA